MSFFKRKKDKPKATSPVVKEPAAVKRTPSTRSNPRTPDSINGDIGVPSSLLAAGRPPRLLLSEDALSSADSPAGDVSMRSPMTTSSRLSKTLQEILRDGDAVQCFLHFMQCRQGAERFIRFWLDANSFRAATLTRMRSHSLQSVAASALLKRRSHAEESRVVVEEEVEEGQGQGRSDACHGQGRSDACQGQGRSDACQGQGQSDTCQGQGRSDARRSDSSSSFSSFTGAEDKSDASTEGSVGPSSSSLSSSSSGVKDKNDASSQEDGGQGNLGASRLSVTEGKNNEGAGGGGSSAEIRTKLEDESAKSKSVSDGQGSTAARCDQQPLGQKSENESESAKSVVQKQNLSVAAESGSKGGEVKVGDDTDTGTKAAVSHSNEKDSLTSDADLSPSSLLMDSGIAILGSDDADECVITPGSQSECPPGDSESVDTLIDDDVGGCGDSSDSVPAGSVRGGDGGESGSTAQQACGESTDAAKEGDRVLGREEGSQAAAVIGGAQSQESQGAESQGSQGAESQGSQEAESQGSHGAEGKDDSSGKGSRSLSVEEMKEKLKKSIERDAVSIFAKYIAKDAPQPIGVDDSLRGETISKICGEDKQVDPECFVACQDFVVKRMEKEYHKGFADSEFHCKHQVSVLTGGQVYLADILYNEHAFCYFMEFMEQEEARHLLQFWMAADNFQQQLIQQEGGYDGMTAQSDAMILYDKFFSLQATTPLGFDDKIRFEVEGNICRESGPLPDCFCKPRDIVLHTIEKLYFPRYLTSDIYYRYLSDLINTVKMAQDLPVRKHRRQASDASSEHSGGSLSQGTTEGISSRNTLLAAGSRAARKASSPSPSTSSSSASLAGLGGKAEEPLGTMDIDFLNPEDLWKRPNKGSLRLGMVNSLGQFVSEFDPDPDGSKKKAGVGFFKKMKSKEKDQEEMAVQVAQMILNDVANMTKMGDACARPPHLQHGATNSATATKPSSLSLPSPFGSSPLFDPPPS